MVLDRTRKSAALIAALATSACGASTTNEEPRDVDVVVPPPPTPSASAVATAAPVRHSTPGDDTPSETAAESTGIPECDAYVATLERCRATMPGLTEAASSVRTAFKQLAEHPLAPETLKAITDGCRQSEEALANVCK